ncbi:hypothetical protein Egran_05357 [Elaphomyces granulatus]|uniref:F-box domain-containing protein n=1 Tax=Elaphomyces granulatus TaxID=519963 RepID=A0A232LRU6_9EURO|nr:hypothetical protein Egran_05357 [Elaphomyces granulatus]
MLDTLPPEIIYHIATFLPTVDALVHLAQTCQRLYKVVTADDSRIFRAFVQSRFPSIETPPLWRDAARVLTSRSRALDRRALICRFVIPSSDVKRVGIQQSTRHDNPTLGYRPAIDSYEEWYGSHWASRREVLVWSTGAELAMRIRNPGDSRPHQWLTFNDLDHISSYDDICGVHLLRPEHPSKEVNKEHLIYGRARGDLVHIAISPQDGFHECKQRYINHTQVEMIDLSYGPDPILVTLRTNGSIAFFCTTTRSSEVHPSAVLGVDQGEIFRQKYVKFLSSDRIAVPQGVPTNSIPVYEVRPGQVSRIREISLDNLEISNSQRAVKAHVRALAPLNLTGQVPGTPGDLFLVGWGDGRIRLHDLRSRKPYEKEFIDTIDTSPTYSIHPFGHDRFLVGAGAGGVVKIFDLRMQNPYDRTCMDADIIPLKKKSGRNDCINRTFPRKDFSIFLRHNHPPAAVNRGHRRGGRLNRSLNRYYSGPIYSMSSPSPSSATVYAGVLDGIFRLDFASSDDLTGAHGRWYHDNLALDLNMKKSAPLDERILEISGYERPGPETRGISPKLMVQKEFGDITDKDVINEQNTGCDRRWERL